MMMTEDPVTEARALDARLESPDWTPGAWRDDVAQIDQLVTPAPPERLPDDLRAKLLAAKARLLTNAEDPDGALDVIDDLTRRFADCAELGVAHTVGYAHLIKYQLLANAARVQDAVRAARELLADFETAPDEANLTGFGFMLLDTTFSLLTFDQHEVVLDIGKALAERLAAMNTSRRAVAAGGHFYAGFSLGQIGRSTDCVAHYAALADMREPGLHGLDRIDQQIGPANLNPTMHGLLDLMRIAILIDLDRVPAAQALFDGVPEDMLETAERAFLPVGELRALLRQRRNTP